jgi:hypothetical protein
MHAMLFICLLVVQPRSVDYTISWLLQSKLFRVNGALSILIRAPGFLEPCKDEFLITRRVTGAWIFNSEILLWPSNGKLKYETVKLSVFLANPFADQFLVSHLPSLRLEKRKFNLMGSIEHRTFRLRLL